MRISEYLRQSFYFRQALSKPAALKALGFHPGSEPIKREIIKAYQELALRYHPDKGGDSEKMKDINLAKDTLLGRLKPTPSMIEDYRPDPNVKYRPTQQDAIPPEKPEPPVADTVTWKEAAREAGVPVNGNWLFRTSSVVDPHLGKVKGYQTYSWIVFGRTEVSQYVVYVSTKFDKDTPPEWKKQWAKYVKQWERFEEVSPEEAAKLEKPEEKAPSIITENGFNMRLMKFPLDADLLQIVTKAVSVFFKSFYWDKKAGVFNKGTNFFDEKKINTWKLKWRPIKDVINVVQSQSPFSAKQLTVILEAQLIGLGEHKRWEIVVLIGNEEYTLSDSSAEQMEKAGILKKLWSGGPKPFRNNRVKATSSHKAVLQWMSQKLSSEPDQLRFMLKAAADQLA